jgi:hypothetical protein
MAGAKVTGSERKALFQIVTDFGILRFRDPVVIQGFRGRLDPGESHISTTPGNAERPSVKLFSEVVNPGFHPVDPKQGSKAKGFSELKF